MKAAIYTRYGAPDVVRIEETARPEPRPNEVLVRVEAAGVTTADWRLRAAAFPGAISKVAGRLMFGLFRPRRPILGHDYAGQVVEVGADVTQFAVGDHVFGFSNGGAHAEYLVAAEDGPIVARPDPLTPAEAAALPFGGLSALEFLDRFAELKPGERVLIVGGSGGVGAYGVQIAKALGAEVTAVASAEREELLRELGADHVVDYRATDISKLQGPFDVVFETIGQLSYPDAAAMMADKGRFVPLNFGLGDVLQTRTAKRNGHSLILKVNGDSKEGLLRIKDLISDGKLRPVVDQIYPFAAIRNAYSHVESRSRKGAVVLQVDTAPQEVRAA